MSKLFTLLTTGQRLKEVDILFVNQGSGAPTVCRSITLADVGVSSVQESFSSGRGGGTVAIAFDYTKITLTTGDGKTAGSMTTSYDLTTNKASVSGAQTPTPTPGG